ALYLSIAYIQPNAAFGINWTIAMVFMVIIGGIGTIEGPVLGALIYVLLNQYLYNFPGISMIILGAVAIIVILVAPGGIMGTLQERFGFELISVRRNFKGA
ncbi:MAG: ABC transporter permease subunit, partial [Desulfotomaculales bacterium]